MKQYLKLGFAVAILSLAVGCSTSMVIPVPTVTQQFNQLDSSSFKALGRVSVAVPVENYDKLGVYEALLKAAKKIGGNDIINIYIDEVHGNSNEYHASALAIKHR